MPAHIEITKNIVSFVVGSSTAFTVKRALTANVQTNKRRHDAEAYVGGFVIGAMVAEQSEAFTDRKIDEYYEKWLKLKDLIKYAEVKADN